VNSDNDAAVEERAQEIFERERIQGETWTPVTSTRRVGMNVNVSSIGWARRKEYHARAREELRQENGL
jgi:hypothetical protein